MHAHACARHANKQRERERERERERVGEREEVYHVKQSILATQHANHLLSVKTQFRNIIQN